MTGVGKKSPLDDAFFSQLAKEAGEDSDVSEADPQALLDSMKDLDDLDAEIFGGRKLKSAPAKDSGMSRSTDVELKTEEKTAVAKRGHSAPESDRKPSSSPVALARTNKKFSFQEDSQSSETSPQRTDDPLAGILSDEDDEITKKTKAPGSKSIPEPAPMKPTDAPLPSPVRPSPASRRKDELTFGEDTDDIMDALGFGESPEKAHTKDSSAPPPARSKLDELLGRGTAAKLLERPPTGDKKEFKLDPKYQKQTEKEDAPDDEDFAFGSYQPTFAPSPEGRPSRRSSVRFSADSNDNLKSEARSNPNTPVSRSPARGERARGDWLGLKDDDIPDLTPPVLAKNPPRSATVTPSSAGRPPSGNKTGDTPAVQPRASQQVAAVAKEEEEEEEWLASALSRKKALKQGKVEDEKGMSQAKQDEPTGNSAPAFPLSTSRQSDVIKTVSEAAPAAAKDSGSPLPWENPRKLHVTNGPAATRPEETTKTALSSIPPEPLRPAVQQPVATRTVDRWGRGDDGDHQGELLQAQKLVLDLEAQVRKLQLERDQQHLLLETLQHRHQEDLELIESAHRSRLKLLEDSAQQREERLHLENQELSAQYLSRCQSAEREKAEMLAQYQKKLTEFQQEKEKEVERIRELQRLSVQDMCRDHEEQLLRLKRLKDQEIDAVTSASSHTRSLNGVIEQMETFSHKLSELSHRVESTQLNTSQELEIGARQREGQLRALQESLSRQRKDMEDERNSLRMTITNMETRLSEQSRLLEQEHWRVSSEQAKVESLQRSLEEQKRILTQQMAIEREELERAKSSLVEEQQSVMSRCAEERRKLAAEWDEFHSQQKLSKERAEKDVSRAILVESQREGAIISLAKEQAELKIKASELRNLEEQLASARETLEKERQELRLEKERVNASALRVRQRAEEIDSMSKLASQHYEEGEKALAEAKRVESEHHGRMRSIHEKLERLRQQEEHLHQERLSLAQQRRQLNQIRQGLPTAPVLFSARPPEPILSAQVASQPIMTTIATADGQQQRRAPQATELHAQLALLKMYAQRDWDFLEDEKLYLESLKKSNLSCS
ncbi:fas-binding factor 1 [Rhinophrynus dorsalis]